jgi:predicted TIM-barrel fold metal-dependent hydrolase
MLIDFHTHIFPDFLASKAIRGLSKNAGGTQFFYDGTKTGLLRFMEKTGIDRSVVLNIATNPDQQKRVNDFAASVNGGPLIAFGSVHPDAPDALSEIDRICDLGLRGIKLHPDYQQFYGDDRKMTPIYEKIAKKRLVLVFHCGADIGLYPPAHMTPARLENALKPLEGATVVAAHFGGYMMWEEALARLCGKDVYLDTAYAVGRMPTKLAAEMIRSHGADRIIFGSDLPWSHTGEERAFIRMLNLSNDEMDKIFFMNAKRILKI